VEARIDFRARIYGSVLEKLLRLCCDQCFTRRAEQGREEEGFDVQVDGIDTIIRRTLAYMDNSVRQVCSALEMVSTDFTNLKFLDVCLPADGRLPAEGQNRGEYPGWVSGWSSSKIPSSVVLGKTVNCLATSHHGTRPDLTHGDGGGGLKTP
jgi:hypothetical protein